MAKTAHASRQPARVVQLRKGTTLEMVRLSCPDAAQATRIAAELRAPPSSTATASASLHERLIVETAEQPAAKASASGRCRSICSASSAPLSARPMAPASSTPAPYRSARRDGQGANDARDEDLDGPVGYDSAAQRKREFAADMGVQSHALRMAAEGAVAAYEQVVGETLEALRPAGRESRRTVDRKAAERQMAAFG